MCICIIQCRWSLSEGLVSDRRLLLGLWPARRPCARRPRDNRSNLVRDVREPEPHDSRGHDLYREAVRRARSRQGVGDGGGGHDSKPCHVWAQVSSARCKAASSPPRLAKHVHSPEIFSIAVTFTTPASSGGRYRACKGTSKSSCSPDRTGIARDSSTRPGAKGRSMSITCGSVYQRVWSRLCSRDDDEEAAVGGAGEGAPKRSASSAGSGNSASLSCTVRWRTHGAPCCGFGAVRRSFGCSDVLRVGVIVVIVGYGRMRGLGDELGCREWCPWDGEIRVRVSVCGVAVGVVWHFIACRRYQS